MEALRHDHTMSNAIPMRAKTHVRLIGRSTQMVALQAEIDRVARSDAKVLITGESGVGKEIVSRAIHTRQTARVGRMQSGGGFSSSHPGRRTPPPLATV